MLARKEILTTGDSSFINIKESFGIDPIALKTHRLYKKQGLKPVLNLTGKEDSESIAGIPFTFVSDQELANQTANDN